MEEKRIDGKKAVNKLVRGKAPWLSPKQHFGPAVACWIAYQRMTGLTLGKVQPRFIRDLWYRYVRTILKLEKWVADTLHDDYEKIREESVKSSAVQC
uniref:Uncharacterized protein n=1 Tax=Candidatus Methanogaster sp. ANME-2c ERB4 TaxID=2759911 RepID=A0A7G9YL33_9EURY|nr:hypothetical protein MNILOELO_00019 [Methanosarcinales archaeon ANME-2c ERB4]